MDAGVIQCKDTKKHIARHILSPEVRANVFLPDCLYLEIWAFGGYNLKKNVA